MSAINHGEILALAEKRGWGEPRRTRLEEVLRHLPTLDVNQLSIIRAYALIDAWSSGSAVDAPNDAPPPKPARKMGQNDLWIAATAHAAGLVLVGTDKDFDHLSGVWLEFEYIDPA